MPYKDPARQKAAQAASYQRNKVQAASRNVASKRRLQALTNEYKLTKGCAHCGYNAHAVALDVHHPGNKLEGGNRGCISQWIRRRFAWEKIKAMLDECEVICANCHRVYHYGEPNADLGIRV